jgi:hypothetical protein
LINSVHCATTLHPHVYIYVEILVSFVDVSSVIGIFIPGREYILSICTYSMFFTF